MVAPSPPSPRSLHSPQVDPELPAFDTITRPLNSYRRKRRRCRGSRHRSGALSDISAMLPILPDSDISHLARRTFLLPRHGASMAGSQPAVIITGVTSPLRTGNLFSKVLAF